MPTHKQDGLPPLTAPNLDCIRSTSETEKAKLIRDFVQSQELYLSRYSKEGRTVEALWDRASPAADGDTPTCKANSREILVSAFDTPILKPRVPATPEDFSVRVEEPQGPKNGSSHEARASEASPVKAVNTKGRHVRSDSQKENDTKESDRQGGKRRDQPVAIADTSTRAKQQTLDSYTAKAKDDTQTSRRKRRRSPESTDPEHAARLAERRERRRVKRAIVAPKAAIDPASDEDSSTSVDPKTKRGMMVNKNKRKSTSLAAGLALMHGFAAKNVGKNRLTVRPEKRNGVFSKGKASVKVGTSTKRTTGVVFSESQFLSTAKRSTRPRQKTCNETSSETSDSSAASETSVDKPLSRSTSVCVPGRRAREALKISEDSEQHCGSSTDKPKMKQNRPPSIMWDIEVDGKSLPSDSGLTQPDKPLDGTVILDTHAMNWTATAPATVSARTNSDEQAPSYRENMKSQASVDASVDASADRASMVSLRPSESASQVPRHPLSLALDPRVSRFFPPLPATPKCAVNDEAISAAGNEGPTSIQSPVHSTDAVFERSPTQQPVDVAEMHFATASMDIQLSDTHSLTAGPAISMSVLDRELRALDDDDHGLLYAVYSQGRTRQAEEHHSVLSVTQPRHLDVGQPHGGPYTLGYSRLETTTLAPSLGTPVVYAWYGQEDCLGEPAEYWHYDTDAGAGSTHPADCLDVDDGHRSRRIYADETTTGLESSSALEDAPLCFVQGQSLESLGFSPVLEPLPYDDDVYMSDPQDFNEGGPEYSDTFVTSSRPNTAASWCSATEEPAVPCSPSAIASTSELSAELHVSSFAQGRDLLLGLSDRSGIRQSHSIASAEEDVARSLRGHWLPQRL